MSLDAFQQRVLLTIRKWDMFAAGVHVGVAVSGGADSVALFRTLHALSEENAWTLCALHANHGLRGPESDGDAEFVQDLASQLGWPCKVANLPVPGDGNLEQEARKLRNGWFLSCIAENCTILHKMHNVALGHTRSDQAETVLFRFLRGSGAAGLSGIRPTLPNGFVRPLLEISRDEVRNYLHEIGQPWREDSSNRDLSFDRNRIRLELLPAIARIWNPAIEHNLAQTADWAQAEEAHWAAEIAALAEEHFASQGPALIARTSSFSSISTAAARRLVRRALLQIRGDLLSIDFAHIERIRSLIAQSEGSGRLQIPGVDIMRSFDWIRFASPGAYAGDRHFSTPVSVPGEFVLSPAGSALTLQVQDADYRYTEDVNRFDAESLRSHLILRTWQPGDQYRPNGHDAQVKLKDLFQTARIPLWDRRLWPVLAMDREIVWSRQFGVAAQFAVKPETRRVVTITEWQADKINTVSPKRESGTSRPTSM